MAIRNIIVELRNTTGSTITMGTLSISPASSEIIWDTTNYSAGATDNFEQVLSDIATFNEAIGNGDLVMEVDNIDQSSTNAWAQFYELNIAFTDERLKDEFSILRQEGESTLGLDIEANSDANINGNNIINVGLVDGVDVSDHSARHENGGADPLDGYNIDLVYSPTNYSDPVNDLIGEHIARIDSALAGAIGTGDVNGPGSATDEALVRFDGITGKLIQNSNATLTDAGALSLTLGLSTGADIDVGGNSITNVNLVDGVDVSGHAARHENGGADEISVTGLSGLLADPQTPTTHATTHTSGGADEIDGDQLDIDWNPTNYTPTTSPTEVTSLDHLTAHLAGIDTILGTVVTDHGGLTGLSDDDHMQYLLVDGTRAMSDSLNMGGNNIVSVGLVDGVNVSTHASRHENGGADEIDVTGLSGVLAQPQTPDTHASTHISLGSDEIDGDQLDIDWNPTNYTPTTSPTEVTSLDHLTAHLAGIDAGLGTIITDHGNLSGLGDDDHTQYLLVDGTRAMSGSLDMGTNNITNVGLVDGVDVSAHASRHENGGADEISVAGLSGLLADPQTPTTHASTHETGGSDAIDGYNVDLVYTPSNYIDPVNDIIGEHIARIDAALATAGSGDVIGPVSSTDNAIARFDGVTGKIIQNSGVTIDDSGNMNLGAGNITTTGTVDGVDVSAHASRHENGGADEINVGGLSGLLADPQTPTTHAASHISGGGDEIDGDQIDIDFTPSNYTPTTAPAEATSLDHLTAHLAGIDNAITGGGVTAPTNPDEDGYVAIASGGDLTYLRGDAEGEVLTWDDTGETWESRAPKRVITVEFVLAENVSNFQQYFMTWRGTGTDSSNGKRSGASSGIQNGNGCSPYQVPFDATITGAVLTLKGAGVQNGSVTYPVTFQTDLFEQDFTTDTKIGDIDFSISNSFTVGTWSPGNTNFKGTTTLDIDVDTGDMLGLKFINGTGASLVGQLRNAFVTLILEER